MSPVKVSRYHVSPIFPEGMYAPYRERQRADSISTVLVPRAGH